MRGRAATGMRNWPDPDGVAEVIARLSMSLVLTRDGTIRLDDPESMRALVTLVLVPILQPPSA